MKLKKLLKLFLFLSLLFANLALAKELEKKNILLLHSYHPGMTWIENINQAVDDTLKPSSNNYVIYTEYMDTKRHHSSVYYKSLKEIYHQKYKNITFDLILSSDNNAFNFLIKNRNELFGEVPVSFCGVNGFEKKMLKGVKKFTGVAEQFSVKETVDTILKLHPNTKNIYIINDYLPTGIVWKRDIQKALKGYNDKINFMYSKNLTLRELKNRVNELGEDTAILLGVYFADSQKRYITYEKIGSYLLEGSNAPVYCLLNFNISNNVIGGKVISGYSQGEAMSKVALRIFKGEAPKSIPIAYSQANKYIFNYNGLKRYGIDDLSSLPQKSQVINRPFSLYQEYESILIDLIIIFALIFTLFIGILGYLKYRNKTDDYRDEVIISVVRFTPIFIVPIVTASVVWLFVYSANKNHHEIKELEKTNYLENKKAQAKREVDRFIAIAKSQIELANANPQNLESIKNNLLYIARNIIYDSNGYLMVGTMDGRMLAHPNPDLSGAHLFDGKHEKARDIYMQFKAKILQEGSGFIKYQWSNPKSKALEEKITYVNLLPELNWYVASGVYIDTLHQHIENKIKNSAIHDEKSINIIILASIILLIFSLAISLILSIIIKNVFKEYKDHIVLEVKKSKEIEKSKEIFEALANTDALTNIPNRLSIMNTLKDRNHSAPTKDR